MRDGGGEARPSGRLCVRSYSILQVQEYSIGVDPGGLLEQGQPIGRDDEGCTREDGDHRSRRR
jgi:hypothetical protein